MKKYGIGYKGSKSRIADLILSKLPDADVFVDLFAGGCAMTHAAAVSGKYKKVICNDLDPMPVELFRRAINGEYKDEKRWISREDFQRLKDADPYVRFCWSFGNNGRQYLYWKELEPWKKALHYALVLGDRSLLREMGIESDGTRKDIAKHFEEYYRKYREYFCFQKTYSKQGCIWLEHIQRGQSIESIQSLQSNRNRIRLQSIDNTNHINKLNCINKRISYSSCSYDKVPIPAGSVVYCDPPYSETEQYNYKKFDSFAFWQWVRSREFPVYVSEYNAPDDFVAILERSQTVNICSGGGKRATEKLFLHRRYANRDPEYAGLPLFDAACYY